MQKGAFTQRHTCKRKIIRKPRKPNHVFRGRVGVSTAIYFEVGLKLARCLLTNWIHFFFSRWSRLETVASLCRSVFGILAALLIWRTGNAILIFHNDAHLSHYRPCWVLQLHTNWSHVFESCVIWPRDSSIIFEGKIAKLRALVKSKGFAIYHSKFGFVHFKGYTSELCRKEKTHSTSTLNTVASR